MYSKLAVEAEILRRSSARSMRQFMQNIKISVSGQSVWFRDVIEQWQVEDYNKIIPAIHALAGLDTSYTGPRFFWRTRPRGSDKTSGIARLVAWPLLFSPRKITAAAAASDAEQADLIRTALITLVENNPWCKLRITKYQVSGPRGNLYILNSEAPTSYGKSLDILLLDEITHWKSDALFRALVSGMAKQKQAVLIVITNAGFTDSWQYAVLQTAKSSPEWDVVEQPSGVFAGWLDQKTIQHLTNILPPIEVKRVLYNEWVSGHSGARLFTQQEIRRCELKSAALGLTTATHGIPGIEYILAVDYGPLKDRTVIGIGHVTPTKEIIIDYMSVKQGSKTDPIQLSSVDAEVSDLYDRFRPTKIVVDPYQMEHLIQTWTAAGKIVERIEYRGGKTNYALAQMLRAAIVDERLLWPPDAGELITEQGMETISDELIRLEVKPTSYGYRISHSSTGHDDRAVVLAAIISACNTVHIPAVPSTDSVCFESSNIMFGYAVIPDKKIFGLTKLDKFR